MNFSDKIADKLIDCGTIKAEDKELYTYGLRQGLLIIGNIFTTLAIGFFLGVFWQSILFMITYLPLRSFAGGYHAKTQARCYFLSIALNVSVLLVIKFLPWTNLIILGLALAAGAAVFTLAPAEDKNKPLDSKERVVYRNRSRIIFTAEFCIVLLFIILKLSVVSFYISVSLFAVSVMLIIGKAKNKSI